MHFFSLNTLPHTSVSLTSCISIFFLVLNILTNLTTMLHVWSLLTMVCRTLDNNNAVLTDLYAFFLT